MRHIFGSHTIDTGGVDMAVRRARAAGLDAVQIFSAIPRFYGDRTGIRPDRVERFRRSLEETAIRAEDVLVHGAYVLNVATPDADKWHRAAAGLTRELARSSALGTGAVCFHPGSAPDGDLEAAAERIARAMVQALRAVEASPRLLVENTAGAGRTFGRTAREVALILERIPPELRPRTGYGLDTCHLWASGYDIVSSAGQLGRVLDEFVEQTGEAPSFFHLNDSAGGQGSNRDRHLLIGEGTIGVEPFRWLLADARSRGIPLVLETPQQRLGIARNDASPDPYDLRMRALLTELAA